MKDLKQGGNMATTIHYRNGDLTIYYVTDPADSLPYTGGHEVIFSLASS